MIKAALVLVFFSACTASSGPTVDKRDPRIQKISVGQVVASAEWKEDQIEENSTKYQFFKIRFVRSGGVGNSSETIRYLNFGICEDFSVVVNENIMHPAICQRIESGQAEVYDYMLAIEKTFILPNAVIQILYNDKIFTVGQIAFVFDPQEILSVTTSRND